MAFTDHRQVAGKIDAALGAVVCLLRRSRAGWAGKRITGRLRLRVSHWDYEVACRQLRKLAGTILLWTRRSMVNCQAGGQGIAAVALKIDSVSRAFGMPANGILPSNSARRYYRG
jgi:hypothetical protein